jgi:hypothetical protein
MNKYTLLSAGPGYKEYWRRLTTMQDGKTLNERVHIVRTTEGTRASIIYYVVDEGGSTVVYEIDCTEREALDWVNEIGFVGFDSID